MLVSDHRRRSAVRVVTALAKTVVCLGLCSGSLLFVQLLEVLVEDHEVVVLGVVVSQAEVFVKKRQKLVRGAVVGKHLWLDLFVFENSVEEVPSVAFSLAVLADVKI